MADKRPGRTGNELPAEDSRRKSPSSHSGPKADGKKSSEVQFRVVADDDLFSGPLEPNDESPTIITLKNSEAIQANKSGGGSDLKGRRLAHYELGEPIGVGGMAAVLRARDTQLDRTVALKILPPEMAKDPENIRRFHQEARAAAKLDHENIARVFYCGEDQGLHFIAFEFVEGENLRTILERRGRIPTGEALRYVRQVATGLEHAASRGVVHRDIKPSNIIITPTGKAKVVDMGLARSLEPHADDGLTQSGVTLGTFDYISPEQALEPREADSRSDIYSLGCTLYHMLTGQPAVPEGTAAKKLHHHQHVAPTDPRQLNPDIPDDVALVLSKMMAKDPRQRYQKPVHLVQQLSQIGKRYDDGSQETFVSVHVPVEPSSRPLLLVCCAVLALAGLLFVLSLAQTPDRKNDLPKGPVVKAPPQIEKKPPVIEPKPPLPPTVTAVRTEDDLQKLIDRAPENETLFIALENDIVLTGKVKLSAKTRPVEIYGAGRQPAKLTLVVDKTPTSALAGLRVDDATVKFRNLRFEISLTEGAKLTGDVPVATVALGSGSAAEFHQCVAYQNHNVPLDAASVTAASPAASVWVDASRGPNKSAYFHDCVFYYGQTGIAITGTGTLTARDCAFSSLGSIVQIKSGDPVITFEHCSAYLRNGPVFRIDEGADAQLKVARSIFTVPATKTPFPQAANVLVKQADTDTTKVLFQGQSNFYRLQLLWTIGGAEIVQGVNRYDSPGLFKEKGRKGSSDDSLFEKHDSATSPFINEFARGDDLSAFLLNPIRELQPPTAKVLGIRKFLGADMIAKRPPLPIEVASNNDKLAPGERLLVPEDLAKIENDNYFPAGNAFVLKTDAMNNEFAIKLKEVESDFSVRGIPGPGGALPTLKFYRLRDAHLFKVLGGKLTLENLNLVIAPDRDAQQTLVALDGFGGCTLKNCTITMRPLQGAKFALSVVSVSTSEVGKMMMNDPNKAPESVPTVVLSDCFIRGDGDVVALKESKPVSVQVSRSLAILGGSLLHQQQAAPKDISGKEPPAGDVIALRMSSSAFFFAEPLVTLQSGKLKPWHQHPLRVESADSCLFTTLEDRPLVSLETLEDREKLSAIFEWKGAGNAYAQFKTAVIEQTSADFRLDEEGWKNDIDRGALFFPSGFKMLPPRPYATAKPGDFMIRSESLSDLQPYLEQRFPVPE